MKFFAWTLAVLLAAPLAWSEGDPRLPLLNTERTLRSMAMALDMYAADHTGHYPQKLAELEQGFYVKKIPGSEGDWLYLRDEQGQAFSLQAANAQFSHLGIPAGWPRVEKEGFQMRPGDHSLVNLPTAPQLPVGEGWLANGSQLNHYYGHSKADLQSRVLSPHNYDTPKGYVDLIAASLRQQHPDLASRELTLPAGLGGRELAYTEKGWERRFVYTYNHQFVWVVAYTGEQGQPELPLVTWVEQRATQLFSGT